MPFEYGFVSLMAIGAIAIFIYTKTHKMKNLKDTVTTICGVVIALSGAVFTMTQSGVVLPEWLKTAATTAGGLAVAVLAYLTGKNPDGSTKSAEQVAKQNEQAK